jgi:membrane protein required for colicin V production
MAVLILVPPLMAIDQDAWWQQSLLIPHMLEFEDWCRAGAADLAKLFGKLFGTGAAI